MTDEEIERIAELIFQKLLTKQEELEYEFAHNLIEKTSFPEGKSGN